MLQWKAWQAKHTNYGGVGLGKESIEYGHHSFTLPAAKLYWNTNILKNSKGKVKGKKSVMKETNNPSKHLGNNKQL